MKTFCTIITSDYLQYALTLRESILEFGDIDFNILVTDIKKGQKEEVELNYPRTKLIHYTELCVTESGKDIFRKYHQKNIDAFRWSMKPLLLKYLLTSGYNEVIYVDCDIHFFFSWQFLFDLLNNYNILLSPHNRSLYPKNDIENFQKNYNEGIFNGGFIGVNKNAIEFLNWFAQVCQYKCKKEQRKGFFDDQKYLDIVPARFDKVHCLQHKGCNISEWNITDCKREIINGEVLINRQYPIVFIHFVPYTGKGIREGTDSLLKPYYDLYQSRLKKYKEIYNSQPTSETSFIINTLNKLGIKSMLNKFDKIFNSE